MKKEPILRGEYFVMDSEIHNVKLKVGAIIYKSPESMLSLSGVAVMIRHLMYPSKGVKQYYLYIIDPESGVGEVQRPFTNRQFTNTFVGHVRAISKEEFELRKSTLLL